VRLLTWNLNARSNAALAQAEAVLALEPDVAVFQEVTARAWPLLRDALRPYGYRGAVAGARDGAEASAPRGVVAFARVRFALGDGHQTPRPDLVVHLKLREPLRFDVLGVHVPTRAGAGGLTEKVRFQEALLHAIRTARVPLVVAGDFNAPKAERGPGDVEAFMPRSHSRAHAAELAFHVHPDVLGLRDAFRHCNGYEPQEISWAWKNRGKSGGYRLDHILASPTVEPRACWYEHALRQRGLSDHSPLVVDLDAAG
jgi:exonuclease III